MVNSSAFPQGTRRTLLAAGLLTVSMLLGAAHPVAPQDSEELKQLLQDLRQVRQAYYVQRDEQMAAIASVRDSVAELRSDVKGLEFKRDELRKDTDSVNAEIAGLASEEQEILSFEAATLATIKGLAPAANLHIDNAVPCRVELRRRKLAAFANAGSARDALSGMWSFCEEELRAARSGETYGDEIQLPDGRTKHARFVRVGLHLFGFVTEDGLDVGLWMSNKGWVSGVDLSLADTEAVRTAVEILDRRRGPAHVTLRVPLGEANSQ